jgi:hypothetical protein
MKSLIHVLILTAASSISAMAGQMTVGDLLKICTSADAGDKVACTFYILGVTQGANLVATTAKGTSGEFREIKNKPFCLPDDISSTALELVVRMKMGEDLAVFPKAGKLPAVSFVVSVINKNFPCQSRKAP